jgi:hypothetical protein
MEATRVPRSSIDLNIFSCGSAETPHLESNTGKATEDFIHIQYLLCDGFGIADEQRTRGASQSVKLCARSWGPAAFFTDLSERVGISWIEILCSLLGCVSQKADSVKAHDEFLRGVSSTAPSFAVKVDQGPKSLGFAANDGDHQWKSERAGTNE